MATFTGVARAERVVVVGAGAAGLAAAAALRRGVEVVVVEARDRVGGRVDTRADTALGLPLEHGAEFVHGRPDRTRALAARAGVALRTVPERHLRRTATGASDAAAAFDAAQELLSRGTRDDVPFARVLAAARRDRPAAVVELAAEFVRGFYLADPATASSFALARFTRALAKVGGETTSRAVGGYARVLDPLVRALRARRADLRLSTVVEEVRWRDGRVELRARGATGRRLAPIAADRAIVTLPLPMLRDDLVRFRPALPEKRRAAAALAMGPVVKVLLRFRRALWPETGPGALSFLHVPGAPVPVLWTLAPVRAPVLVGWAGGPDARALSGRRRGEVIAAALRSAARGLGRRPGALEEALDGAAVADWCEDPFARGGYAVFPVGSDGAADALARPVAGTLFFAGEATAGGLAGTVEGAIRSGERAAREVNAWPRTH